MLNAVAKDFIADCETEGENISGITLGDIYTSCDEFFLTPEDQNEKAPDDRFRRALWRSNDTNPAELTEQSVERLEAEGWEVNTLKLTIVVVQGKMGSPHPDGTDNPPWYHNDAGHWGLCSPNESEYRKTYVSTDNGETWTLVDMVDANGNAIESDDIGGKTGTPVGEDELIQSYLYTYLHIRKEGFTKDTGNPEPPEPTPTPAPEPTTTPEPDPDNPPEEIPDPDVPLTDPELLEEPSAEPPVEEIETPDVPLSDIPETGDISDWWYGVALLSAVGLLVLLYQQYRGKKTA